jgi:hypothetical protein
MEHVCRENLWLDDVIVPVEWYQDHWVLNVNGNEYLLPIRYCPFCGLRLVPPGIGESIVVSETGW